MKKQFKNQHRLLESFGYEFLVSCPNCKSKAKVISLGEHSPYRTGITKRFLCLHCGMTKEFAPKNNCFNQSIISYGSKWNEGYINIGGAYDWYFGYPLYLQIACCGHTLWAYNLEHLEYIKNYVEAEIRENGTYYLSVESRLPFWIKSTKNRDAVLKAISKLEKVANQT
ncbi:MULTISPECIES: hypothetical protein [unclassified Mesobacillus]|uniref:hypothetical protein n=1 Tax=unclassified Mesobacillus TaxID=2675270 RepID=UPI00203C7A66|nr:MULTISPECIES: hypothetical protein [unclassified Mesobacillus]MCM3124486.1 hypothetical protein [Mesobacillus sp. MER 33]MCM3234804.1 hypothetical protein [Mesobacillus sp. MER 48]